MLTADELHIIAKTRFEESTILHDNSKFDGAIYLCGYALELILKRKIVLHLDWLGFPENTSEFKELQSFKTHSPQILLRLSGLEKIITSDANLFTSWNTASSWSSDFRYRRVGSISKAESKKVIQSTRDVINWVRRQ